LLFDEFVIIQTGAHHSTHIKMEEGVVASLAITCFEFGIDKLGKMI